MSSLKRIYALTLRNLKEIVREPVSLIFLYVLPLVMLVLFYYLFSSATDQFKMGYLAPGMIAFSNTFLTLFLGTLVATDRSSSFIIRLYTTNIRPYEFILGYVFSMIPIGASQTALVLLIAGLIDVSFFGISMLLTLITGVFVSILFISFGLLLGSLCSERSVGGLASIIVTGQSVLSGMWFPIEGINEGFVKFMGALPFRNASMLLQNVNAGALGTDTTLKPFIILTAYIAVVTAAAIASYSAKMKQ